MVGGRLGGGVGGVGPERALLGKVALRPQRAVHLVRGDMQETEGVVVLPFEDAQVGERGLEEFVGLDHIGLYKGLRTVDGAVDVRLGGEVDDGRGTILGEQAVDQRAVPYPPLYEDVVGVIRDRRQGARVAGVGQGVEIDHPVVSHRMQDEVAPYKAGAAGDEDGLFLSLQCAPLSWLTANSFPASSLLDGSWGRHVLATPRRCVILFLRCGLWLLHYCSRLESGSVKSNRPDFQRKARLVLNVQARESRQGVIRRYRGWLPEVPDDAIASIGEGETPLIEAVRISERVGARLFLKFEGMNPTASFKDRGMTVAMSRAAATGSHACVCASTGNTAASAVAYAARAGMECFVVVPAGKIALGKAVQVLAHGARIVQIEGNFDEALRISQKLAAERDDVTLVNSVNPDRIEGQKTAAFEVCEVLGSPPDAMALPVGNAGNITSYWRGFSEWRGGGRPGAAPPELGVPGRGGSPPGAGPALPG